MFPSGSLYKDLPVESRSTLGPTSTSKGWPKRTRRDIWPKLKRWGALTLFAQGAAMDIRVQHVQLLEVSFGRSFCIHL